jgi:RNA polymerase sigma-54 factor
MALEQRLIQRLSQQLVMTPQLQQAIKLLQLSRMELVDEINQELQENPTLELTAADNDPEEEEHGPREEKPVPEPAAAEVKVTEKISEEFDWDNYLGEYSSSPSTTSMYEAPEDAPSYESYVSAKTTLAEHLVWQWSLTDLTEKEHAIGVQIIGNLNSDGYLKAELQEIAELEGVEVEQVERILAKVQELDPVGVASRDLRECLLLQLIHLELGDSLPAMIVADHLHDLENKNYQKIAKVLKTSKEIVYAAEKIILSLEPRPGRQFNSDETQFISPDVYIHKVGGEYAIVLNEDGLPRLRVSNYYRELLSNSGAVNPQAKEYIQGKLRAATWLIRSINQRQRTIYRVTESIIKFQREFLDKGVEYLKPLVLRDVAEDVELHESTISRVTTNKYVHTPQGMFELKFFFDSPINRYHGEAMASESVKKRIKQIVSAEDPLRPLSDQRIVEMLQASDIDIARRTVAKYREMLGISSSSKRKKHY